MPLMVMSANIQGLESPSRKRSHEEFSESEKPSKPDLEIGGGPLKFQDQRQENLNIRI